MIHFIGILLQPVNNALPTPLQPFDTRPSLVPTISVPTEKYSYSFYGLHQADPDE